MFRRNLNSHSLLFKSHRLGNESIQSSSRVNHVQGKAQVRAVAGSTFITHQLRQSSSSSNADPSTSKTWDQLKSEIESQQKIEKEELEKDPSRQQSSDLASIIRMRMAENSTQSSSSSSQSLDLPNQQKIKPLGKNNRRNDSKSTTRSEEEESASSNPLFTLATKKDNYFTTSVASTESIGGIFQNAYVVSDRNAYSSNEFSDQSWLLISIPDFKKDFFKRSYFSSILTYSQSVEFLIKISELITKSEDVGSQSLSRAKPKKLYLESNGRIKLEFGRILDFGFAKQMQRKKQTKHNHNDLLRWTKTGNEKDCLITESDVELAGEVERLWVEFVEEKALEKEHRRNFNASQNPKVQALSASMGLSERTTSSKQDEIEEHTPIAIHQVSKPKSQSMTNSDVKESALSTGLGIKERGETTPPVEEFRPVEIGSSTSQSRNSLKDDKVKESAIAVGLGVKGRSKSDSAGIEESRPVEIGSGSQGDGLDSQKVKQSALETGLGIKDRNQRSKPIEESRPVEVGTTSTHFQNQSGEDQLKDGKVKESAIGLGLGIDSRERESNSKGIEESRPVEIKTQRSPSQDTNSISERSTKESALKVGMGLTDRESSEETGKVEENRPVEIESDVKKRRDEMGLMSGNQSQKDVGIEEKAIGKGLGLGPERGGKVEDKVEEMTPVKIGGEER